MPTVLLFSLLLIASFDAPPPPTPAPASIVSEAVALQASSPPPARRFAAAVTGFLLGLALMALWLVTQLALSTPAREAGEAVPTGGSTTAPHAGAKVRLLP